jgi:hypothetical protein
VDGGSQKLEDGSTTGRNSGGDEGVAFPARGSRASGGGEADWSDGDRDRRGRPGVDWLLEWAASSAENNGLGRRWRSIGCGGVKLDRS